MGLTEYVERHKLPRSAGPLARMHWPGGVRFDSSWHNMPVYANWKNAALLKSGWFVGSTPSTGTKDVFRFSVYKSANLKYDSHMRKFLIAAFVLGLGLLTAIPAYAWFRAHAQVYVRPHRISAAVQNNQHHPMRCRGRVFGRLRSGHVIWSNIGGTVYPGRHMYAYVYTNDPYNSFVSGWANVQCRTY